MPVTKREYYEMLKKAAIDGTLPSVTPDSQCLYRGPNETKCVVGILIEDEDYHESFEGSAVWDLDHELIKKILPQSMTIKDLEQIQDLHDRRARMDSRGEQVWNGEEFIEALNQLDCFKEFASVNAGELKAPE